MATRKQLTDREWLALAVSKFAPTDVLAGICAKEGRLYATNRHMAFSVPNDGSPDGEIRTPKGDRIEGAYPNVTQTIPNGAATHEIAKDALPRLEGIAAAATAFTKFCPDGFVRLGTSIIQGQYLAAILKGARWGNVQVLIPANPFHPLRFDIDGGDRMAVLMPVRIRDGKDVGLTIDATSCLTSLTVEPTA